MEDIRVKIGLGRSHGSLREESRCYNIDSLWETVAEIVAKPIAIIIATVVLRPASLIKVPITVEYVVFDGLAWLWIVWTTLY